MKGVGENGVGGLCYYSEDDVCFLGWLQWYGMSYMLENKIKMKKNKYEEDAQS